MRGGCTTLPERGGGTRITVYKFQHHAYRLFGLHEWSLLLDGPDSCSLALSRHVRFWASVLRACIPRKSPSKSSDVGASSRASWIHDPGVLADASWAGTGMLHLNACSLSCQAFTCSFPSWSADRHT